jgi:hypothetical protein
MLQNITKTGLKDRDVMMVVKKIRGKFGMYTTGSVQSAIADSYEPG